MIKGLILLFYLMREWFFVFALAEAHRLSPTSLVHFWQQNNFQILYQTQACRFKKKKKKKALENAESKAKEYKSACT